jgi:hypothetical protein
VSGRFVEEIGPTISDFFDSGGPFVVSGTFQPTPPVRAVGTHHIALLALVLFASGSWSPRDAARPSHRGRAGRHTTRTEAETDR